MGCEWGNDPYSVRVLDHLVFYPHDPCSNFSFSERKWVPILYFSNKKILYKKIEWGSNHRSSCFPITLPSLLLFRHELVFHHFPQFQKVYEGRKIHSPIMDSNPLSGNDEPAVDFPQVLLGSEEYFLLNPLRRI